MFFVTTLWFLPLFWVRQKKGPLATDRQPATPLAIRHPRSNSPLWRTPKPNLETFKGRCHSEKCRAWWTEYFVMLRGVWGGGIVLILWMLNLLYDFFFLFYIQHTPHQTPTLTTVAKCSEDHVIWWIWMTENVQLSDPYTFQYEDVPWKF